MRERAAALGNGAVVDHGDALGGDLLAHQAGEGRSLLAVEITLQPVADGFVQHHPRPAGGQHDVEGAGRCGHRSEIDQGLAQRLVGRQVPAVLGQELAETLASAHAVGTALLTVAVADHHGHVHPHQRPDVTHDLAVAAHDLDMLPRRGERSGDLPHARIGIAQIAVDFGEQFRFLGEGGVEDRVLLAVKVPVGALRRSRERSRIAAP